ncbi:MAG: hypothetical protein AB1481_02665 [Candidatus Omnitrophota bacterium]
MLKKVLIITIFLFFVSNACAQEPESITITTYYPSPHGIYNKLRLFPHTPVSSECDGPEDIGAVIFDEAEYKWRGCKWNNLASPPAYEWYSLTSYWAPLKHTGDPDSTYYDIYNSANPWGNVGIGPGFGPLYSPATKLHVISEKTGPQDNVVRLDGNGITIHPISDPLNLDAPATFTIRAPISATSPVSDTVYMVFKKANQYTADWVFITPRAAGGGLLVNNDGRVGVINANAGDPDHPENRLLAGEKLTIEGDATVTGNLTVNGTSNKVPQGVWCGLCVDNTSQITCNGASVCGSPGNCPAGYTPRSGNLFGGAAADVICVKN